MAAGGAVQATIGAQRDAGRRDGWPAVLDETQSTPLWQRLCRTKERRPSTRHYPGACLPLSRIIQPSTCRGLGIPWQIQYSIASPLQAQPCALAIDSSEPACSRAHKGCHWLRKGAMVPRRPSRHLTTNARTTPFGAALPKPWVLARWLRLSNNMGDDPKCAAIQALSIAPKFVPLPALAVADKRPRLPLEGHSISSGRQSASGHPMNLIHGGLRRLEEEARQCGSNMSIDHCKSSSNRRIPCAATSPT
mmetsp:Transcript_128994/g.412394  ORF Transcript_128994/g.412394 Transcript_128994/m.412394 type:complete len:249 (-) Transcript_128994:1169-1915(-)